MTCPAEKGFARIDDPSDVLVLRCDKPAKHGGRVHHDPDKNADWFGDLRVVTQ